MNCPNCDKLMIPHLACQGCGWRKGDLITQVRADWNPNEDKPGDLKKREQKLEESQPSESLADKVRSFLKP